MYHDHETAGHPGELENYNGIRQNYWWPGLWTFVRNYVQGCGICQQFKINRSPSNPAYIAIEGANNTRPFAKCSMDLIMDLLLVEGYVVDQGLLEGVILCPCAKQSHGKELRHFCEIIFSKDLDYRVKSSLTETQDLLPIHSKNC
jgi:Integrase zinc binding domain